MQWIEVWMTDALWQLPKYSNSYGSHILFEALMLGDYEFYYMLIIY